MEGFEIQIGRDFIDPRVLMRNDPSLARVMGQMNMCTCFAGMLNGTNVAAGLLNEQFAPGVVDISNLSVTDEFSHGDLRSRIVTFIMEYARQRGHRYLEIGIGNGDLEGHEYLQKTGFRVIGVVPDHYQSDGRSLIVENGIVNRDMIRYRVDFQDGWVTWTKEVKQR